MFLLPRIGAISSVNGPLASGLPRATNIDIPGTLSVGIEASGSYNYVNLLLIPEANKPPYVESLTLSPATGLSVGMQVTATVNGLIIPNGNPAGSHTYRWYRCSDKKQGNEVLIAGATGSTYTITSSDGGYYLRCEVDPKQTGGINTTGDTVKSFHTEIIDTTAFLPWMDIAWDNAYVHNDTAGFGTSQFWPARGSKGEAIQDGIVALPVYDAIKGALRFTRSSSQNLLFPKKNPAMAEPCEVWVKFELASDPTANTFLLSWSSSLYVMITSANRISVSSANATQVLSPNLQYVARIVFNGASSTVEINHGVPETINVPVFGFGNTNGRIGSSFVAGSFFDGWIHDVFINDTPLTSEEQIKMWTWFGM